MPTDSTSAPDGLTPRQWAGLAIAPVLFAWLMWGPLPAGLTPEMRSVAALTAVMATLWVSEAVPLAATALLPLVVLPVFGVARPVDAASAYASDLIFLFIGGFVLANGLERWGLHRRLALWTLQLVGTAERRLVGGLMAVTAFVSLWISNTAAALLMMPVALSVCALARDDDTRLRTAMVLGISLAASIGGMGTPIGSTPNLLLVSLTQRMQGVEIDFARWMAFGVPLVVVLTAFAWWLLTFRLHPLGRSEIADRATALACLRAEVGPWRFGEGLVAVVFSLTALAWIFREPKPLFGHVLGLNQLWPWLSDGTIAIAGALALFLLPVSLRPGRFALDWESGGRMPWDVILLFGGGLSLAAGIQATGLDRVIVESLGGLAGLPAFWALVGVVIVTVFFSEVASNTATAALLLPLLGPLAHALGAPPLFLMLPVTLAASLGFMLPAATPPNALAISTGHVSPAQMAVAGLLMNLVGAAAIVGLLYAFGFAAFEVRP